MWLRVRVLWLHMQSCCKPMRMKWTITSGCGWGCKVGGRLGCILRNDYGKKNCLSFVPRHGDQCHCARFCLGASCIHHWAEPVFGSVLFTAFSAGGYPFSYLCDPEVGQVSAEQGLDGSGDGFRPWCFLSPDRGSDRSIGLWAIDTGHSGA